MGEISEKLYPEASTNDLLDSLVQAIESQEGTLVQEFAQELFELVDGGHGVPKMVFLRSVFRVLMARIACSSQSEAEFNGMSALRFRDGVERPFASSFMVAPLHKSDSTESKPWDWSVDDPNMADPPPSDDEDEDDGGREEARQLKELEEENARLRRVKFERQFGCDPSTDWHKIEANVKTNSSIARRASSSVDKLWGEVEELQRKINGVTEALTSFKK